MGHPYFETSLYIIYIYLSISLSLFLSIMYPIFMDLTERSEVPVPPCLIPVELKIDEGLTDLELFKMHCLPIVDRWDDVP